jgi:hypothetical protein
MKRNHVSYDKIRIGIVSLFVLAILASAFFITSLSALADDPSQSCQVHLQKAAAATDQHTKDMHLAMYQDCIHQANVKKFDDRHSDPEWVKRHPLAGSGGGGHLTPTPPAKR